MKTLLIMRHAKSSWAEPGQTDIRRPLNKRGRQATVQMAKRLVFHQSLPDKILSSSAQRTLETATLLSENQVISMEQCDFQEALYLASAEQIIQHLRSQTTKANTLMVLAHNPGVTDFVNSMSNLQVDNLPTAAVVSLSFEIMDWSELSENKTGKLNWFEFPRMFE
jgi:phosphohistidine phosphatase